MAGLGSGRRAAVARDPAIAGERLLDALTTLASHAGAAILALHGELRQREKPDRSPVTAADEASEALILQGLAKLLPGVPLISEEAGSRAPVRTDGDMLLVDPLDGTRELLAGEREYTVNIALVSGGTPVLGVVAAPALGLVWRGIAGHGAERWRLPPGTDASSASERIPIHTRARPPTGTLALISRFHNAPATDAWLDRIPGLARMICGSSLKFCRLAEGAADLYPRLSPMSEWDIAAGHAVLVAAGGAMTRPDGAPLVYGQGDFRVSGFVAFGDRAAGLPVTA
jgi:3'(2'), 5'-bisphosphate nucleotidase